MRKSLLMVMTTGLLAGMVTFSQAQDWTIPLDERALSQLGPEAREYYNDAWHQIDRAGFDIGVALLDRAARNEPTNRELQFYTAARAMNRARVYYSAGSYRDITDEFFNQDLRRATQPPWLIDEIFLDGTVNSYSTPPWKISEAFIDLAERSYNRLGEIENLTREEQTRLERMRGEARDLRANLTTRDTARRESARHIVEYIFRSRRDVFFEAADPFDPKNPFDVEAEEEVRGIIEREIAEDSLVDDTEYNPFAVLPSQFTDPVFPPLQPAQPQPGFGMPQQMDEFGRPIGQPMVGFGPGDAEGMDPFGGPGFGGPAPAPGAPPGGEPLF